MSLSFVSGTWSLSTWGFGAADIALLSGAGRNVGTWLMANYKDRTLFEFLGTDVDTLLTRRGLLDTSELHKRWDQLFTLPKNDRRTTFKIESINGARQTIQHMDRFTWLMVLFTAALDASMQDSDLRETLCLFMLHLLEDQAATHDFVRHEIDHHVSGWRSAACVRGIALSTRNHWTRLATVGVHQPGFMPRAEIQNVVHFLAWIASGTDTDKTYSTSSTDIFGLAQVLQHVGVALKTCDHANAQRPEENELTVMWTRDLPFVTAMHKAKRQRRTGMRIPLNHIQEVASVHPSDRNEIRDIFEKGMEVIEQDNLYLQATYFAENPPYVTGSPFRENHQDILYRLHCNSMEKMPRLEGDAFRLSQWLFPTVTPALARGLLGVISTINQSAEERHNLEMLAMTLDNHTRGERFINVADDFDFGESVSKLQAFVLGYWYALLLPLIDASQVGAPSLAPSVHRRRDVSDRSGQEAYGAWSWSDRSCLAFIRDIAATRMEQRRQRGKTFSFYRLDLLKAVSYLFGGCEARYVREVKFGAVGMHGKLTTVYSSLTGCKLDDVGKFCLLEIDPSCIPSSASGIILAGIMHKYDSHPPDELLSVRHPVRNLDISSLISANIDSDLTLHIEPDWDHDVQTCLVAYRHGGRIITRLNPCQIDLALLRISAVSSLASAGSAPPESEQRPGDVEVPLNAAMDLRTVHYSALHGFNRIVVEDQPATPDADGDPRFNYTPIVFDTVGRWNARVCILCIYAGWQGNADVGIISSQQDLLTAIERRKRVLLVKERDRDLRPRSSHGQDVHVDNPQRLSTRTRGYAR